VVILKSIGPSKRTGVWKESAHCQNSAPLIRRPKPGASGAAYFSRGRKR